MTSQRTTAQPRAHPGGSLRDTGHWKARHAAWSAAIVSDIDQGSHQPQSDEIRGSDDLMSYQGQSLYAGTTLVAGGMLHFVDVLATVRTHTGGGWSELLSFERAALRAFKTGRMTRLDAETVSELTGLRVSFREAR